MGKHEEEHATHDHPPSEKHSDVKKAAFFIIGVLTLIYCIAELAAALYINSLTLLSDGFHNLSDVVSLYIAYWAQNASKRAQSDDMSYGWARTEILGGLTNGCFLLSLCLYVSLEAVPKIIRPEALGLDCKGQGCEFVYELFIIIAAAGLFVNTVGTIVFAFAGLSHAHSHSHGHGHGHGHDSSHSKKNNKKLDTEDAALLGNVNFDGSEVESDGEHSHDHGHGHEHEHEHEHGHKNKSDKKNKNKHEHKHEHSNKREHKHEHGKKKNKKPKKEGMFAHVDVNMWAVFIHYLGDAVSSLVVLGTGIMLHYFHAGWALYIDPVSSLIIVVLIVSTTVPLVKRCSVILLQGVPEQIDMDSLRTEVGKLDYIVSIHDLHIWQLVDGMIIASVHLLVEEGGNLGDVLYHVKRIFHKYGIHSSAIQPEFVQPASAQTNFCAQNCVEECDEDWCCKKTADRITGV